jgi:hypothetical protein
VLRYRKHPGHAPLSANDRAAFERRLGKTALAWVNKAYDDGAFARILVLADPTAGCGFTRTTLSHANGTAPKPIIFVALNLFVRVWRRLGWPIDDTDQALTLFLPSDPDPRTHAGLGPAIASALLGLAHLDRLAELLKIGPDSRRDLLTLWAPLDDRHYVELFLAGGAATRDPLFDDALGRYLTVLADGRYRPFTFDPEQPEDRATGNVGLRNHLAAVQAALALTADEVTKILGGADRLAAAPLNRDTVSLLYRHGLLARLLKLGVTELRTLVELSRLDPFAAPPDRPIERAADDQARLTVRFVEVATTLHESGLGVAELDYLLRHRFDPVGPYRAAGTPPLDLVRTLASEVTRIRVEHAVPADPLTFTDEVLARSLALVLEPEVGTRFLAMWRGEEDVDRTFVEEHLLRRQISGVGQVGFLTTDDAASLFTPTPGDQAAECDRRARLARELLPHLQDHLIRARVVETVAGDLGAEPALVESLVTDPQLLDDPDRPGRSLLRTYTAAAGSGLTVTKDEVSGYLEVPVTGGYRFTARRATADTEAKLTFDHLSDPLIAVPAGTKELEPATSLQLRAGVPYGFTLRFVDGPATLLVEGEQVPRGPVSRLVTYRRASVEHLQRVHLLLGKTLRLASILKLTEVELRHLHTHPDDFDRLDLGALPTRASDVTAASAGLLFNQLLRLVDWVRLRSELSAEPEDLVRLIAHARRPIPAGSDPEDVAEETLAEVCGLLATLTRRDPAVVKDAADLLRVTAQVDESRVTVAELAQERGLLRVWEVLSLAARLGVEPAMLRAWAQLAVGGAAAPAAVARDVRDAVKARYQPEQWRRVAQPIFDRLRKRRRDALVDHLVHVNGFERVEQLFEFFLIDPGTEPVVQTSRLRLAISSVQTFIQRCLLDLEPGVHPSVLDADQWEWMKRYRVWEANRKVFLWPANWLEPEFRDDKSHLCDALEGALLESDLDRDDVEAAFFDYLRGLDEIARLDVRSVYLEERPAPGANVLHVLGRTFRQPHKYFYRRYALGMWTPWMPMDVDIEGDHVALMFWRDRVHVFWVSYLDGAEANAGGLENSQVTALKVKDLVTLKPKYSVEAQLNWSELFEGEWSEPMATGFILHQANLSQKFDPAAEALHARVDDAGHARLTLSGSINMAFVVRSKHSRPDTVSDTKETFSLVPYKLDGILDNVVGNYKVVITQTVMSSLPAHIAKELRPFFFSDEQRTFFVEPILTETTTEETVRYTIVPLTEPDEVVPWSDECKETPWYVDDEETRWPIEYYVIPGDPVTEPGTFVSFEDRLIGSDGSLPIELLSENGCEIQPAVPLSSLATVVIPGGVPLGTSEVSSILADFSDRLPHDGRGH